MSSAPAINILRSGTFTSVEGAKVSFTARDLAQIAASYKPETDKAPIVVGHPKTNDPAFGWVGSLAVEGDVLVARPSEIVPSFAEAVRAGHYRKVSAQLYQPGDPNSPDPAGWYLKHVGFLGAAAPAVKGLGEVSLGEGGDAVTLTLSFAETRLAGALNAAIDKHDRPRAETIKMMADAAGIAPNTVNEILNGDIASPPDERLRGFARVLGLSFKTLKSLIPTPEISMAETVSLSEHDAAIAAKDAEIEKARAEVAKIRAEAVHAWHVSFVEGASKAGKVAPAAKAPLIGLLDCLATLEPVSFAEGEAAIAPADQLKKLIDAGTPLISFGEAAAPEKGDDKPPVSFAAPAGYEVTPEMAALHARAKALQAQNPELDWWDAVTRAQAAG